VRRAQGLAIPVESRSLESLAGTSWDVVSMINVFSHLPDPLVFLEEVRALLRPGGELLLVTGNGAEIERAEYPQALSLPDHIVFGGEPQLRRFLEQAGFAIEQVARFSTAMPRPVWEARAEALAARLTRRRVGYSGTPFRSLWIRARRSD
jgi:2-polyprenyl-3-methyl-5-hydroxy-6-metoxy-1,4-benzoquinol methylase